MYCLQYTKSDEPLTPPVIKLAAGDVKMCLPDGVKNFLSTHVKNSLPHDVKKFLPRHVKNSLPCGCKITLPRTVFYEIGQDVLDEAGNDHSWEDADSIEKAEIWKRLNEYLELIPQYRHIAEKIYPKDK